MPESLNIPEQPYLSLWPANRRREDAAAVRETAGSSSSSIDKAANSNRVPNRKEYQIFIFEDLFPLILVYILFYKHLQDLDFNHGLTQRERGDIWIFI